MYNPRTQTTIIWGLAWEGEEVLGGGEAREKKQEL